ncbi:hypothetical protein [Caballeronia arvi]|uniref:hypothetical protein n=1 Tax=Caballeronia arvi TaxID=1777135 RepID=UPI00135C697B|nr:hypothetical protein [Caballeronia arvi]
MRDRPRASGSNKLSNTDSKNADRVIPRPKEAQAPIRLMSLTKSVLRLTIREIANGRYK